MALKHELSSKGDSAELELGIDFDTYLDKVLNEYVPLWLDYGQTKSKQGGKVSVVNNQTFSFNWNAESNYDTYGVEIRYTFTIGDVVSVTGLATYNLTEPFPF